MMEHKSSVDRGGAETRARILDAATRIVAERGVAGLRIREVARAAGIREGSIYNHFTGREDIIRAIFHGVDAAMSPFGAVLDLETTPADQREQTREFIRAKGLEGFLAGSREHLVRHFEGNPVALRITRAVLSARFHDEDARKAYEEVFLRDMRRVFHAACTLAAEAGRLKPSLRPEALAGLLVAVLEHALGGSLTEGDLGTFRASLDDLFGVVAALLAG